MLGFVDTALAAPVRRPDSRVVTTPFSLGDATYPASVAAAGRLGLPGALAVTTGQQPGLFTGPLLTIHKALSARAVAAILEREWQRPVVPVFWVAGDDHDFAEAGRTSWLSASGDLVTARLSPRSADAPLTPMYRERLTEEVVELLGAFEDSAAPGERRDRVVAWLGRHYRAGATVAGAFGGALAELLAPLGVVCLDAASPRLKHQAWPLLRRALERWAELDARLVRRAADLSAAGTDPGVKVGDGATLVMLEGAAGRDRLLPDDGAFVTRRSRERWTLADLDRIAVEEPTRLSPNVLLRPVVEAAVLPTVAYLAGPAELRYLELASTLYPHLAVHRQLPLPRWSGIVVEPRVTRALQKLGLDLDGVLREGRRLEDGLARAALPPALESGLATLRNSIDTGYERLAGLIDALDPTLERPVRAAGVTAIGGLAELEKRMLQAVKRKQAELHGQLDRVLNAVLPNGEPQERVLGLPGLLARYGDDALDELAAHIDRWYAGALEAGRASP